MNLSVNSIYDLSKESSHQNLQILLSNFPLKSLQKSKKISKKYILQVSSW